jgi:molybdopterin molybdotransferase
MFNFHWKNGGRRLKYRRFKLTDPLEALRKLLETAKNGVTLEEISTFNACGRIIAEEVKADQNIPPYDGTWLDGYALRSVDTKEASAEKPATLKLVGSMEPGMPPQCYKLSKGEAVKISTGAFLPLNADAVVRLEEVEIEAGRLLVKREVPLGANVTRRGEDIEAGSILYRKGFMLRPQDVGLLLGLGKLKVKVYAKPKVSVLSVGSELLEAVKSNPAANNYAYLAAFLAESIGADARVVGIAPDEPAKIASILSEVLKESSMVLTIGGCSIGEKDFVPEAVNMLGSPRVIVHGLLVRPGHPTGFGAVEGKPVIMLPGHVVSMVVGFYWLAAPLIQVLRGFRGGFSFPTVKAVLEKDEANLGGRYYFLRCSIRRENGEFKARGIHGGAGILRTLKEAGGFIIIPPKTELKAGSKVEVCLFNWFEALNLSATPSYLKNLLN